ncbi:AAA family ATPase [Patescibacteria group bacterium]|nr:AAA family ATPase [Patescibacteria group bacterium]
MKKNKLICIVGLTGSGKTEVANYFTEKNYYYVRFGQLTLDEVKKRGLEPTEENERPIREAFRKEHGPAAFAILNMPKFEEGLARGNVIGDGLYSWSEYKVLKEKFGDDLIIISIIASPKIRYARLTNRADKYGDDPKMIHRSATLEAAKARDYAEIENIEKAGPIAMGDYTIINEGSLEDFQDKIKKIFNIINNED